MDKKKDRKAMEESPTASSGAWGEPVAEQTPGPVPWDDPSFDSITHITSAPHANSPPPPPPGWPEFLFEEPQADVGAVLKARHSFRLEKRLGRGGMGSVFLATCLTCDLADPTSPPELVALKLFHPHGGLRSADLLKRELSAMLALSHDRIPKVYDWGFDDPNAFVAFEYFPNGSLTDRIRSQGPLDEKEARHLLGDLLAALNTAHRASILHLDIKPGNVLVDTESGYVLSDFGISQGSLVSRNVIPTGLGAFGFQSPEQRRMDHDAFDARTDLWGVGVTVWCACTGIVPSMHPEIIREGTPEDPRGLPPIQEYRPEFSREFDDLVGQLIAVDPGRRPGSAAEVLTRVQFLKGLESESDFRSTLGGIDSDARASLGRAVARAEEITDLVKSLVDPLWSSICLKPAFHRYFVKYQDGEILTRSGEKSYYAFVLLQGKIVVERDGKVLATETREGSFLGEVTTLTGLTRTATLRADGDVWACVFNAAELENFVMLNPAVGIRLIKSLAERLHRETYRKHS